jgi:hypothetical protein
VSTNSREVQTEGDTFQIGGETLVIQGEPLRDVERLVWTIEARPA